MPKSKPNAVSGIGPAARGGLHSLLAHTGRLPPAAANAHRGIPDHVFPRADSATAMSKPLFAGDMASARTFFLMLKVGMTAVTPVPVAERVLYPIEVRVNGKPAPSTSLAYFERNYEEIFNSRLQAEIAGADAGGSDARAGWHPGRRGALWFNQFCADPACTLGEFLITRSITSEAVDAFRRALLYVPGDDRHRSRGCRPGHRLRLHGHGGRRGSGAQAQGADRDLQGVDEVDFGPSERLARINAVDRAWRRTIS